MFLCPVPDNLAVVMSATPQIRYFESRRGYYTQYKKRQRLLAKGPKDEPDGPTYQQAVRTFSEIIHCGEADRAEDNNLVITVLDRYAVHLKNQDRERTLEMFRNFDRAQGAIVHRHDAEPPDYVQKTARKTGKDRVIFLNADLRAMVERLAMKYPTGPLLRNRDGRPWTNSSVYLMLSVCPIRGGFRKSLGCEQKRIPAI